MRFLLIVQRGMLLQGWPIDVGRYDTKKSSVVFVVRLMLRTGRSNRLLFYLTKELTTDQDSSGSQSSWCGNFEQVGHARVGYY